jgi:type II secretion system protein N
MGPSASDETPPRLPRRLVAVVLPLALLVLVGIFLLALFPYGRFHELVVARLSQATGARVSLEHLEGGLSIGGPSLTATSLLLRWPDRRALLLERTSVRPAWSLSWLRGEPALHLEATGPAGSIDGSVWPSSEPAFAGQVRGIQLSLLPLDHLANPLPVLGRLDALIDLRTGPAGSIGEIRFEAREGSIALPSLPFDVPYQEAHGDVERSESGAFVVRELELTGPMLSASATGSIAANRRPEEGALDLEVDLVVVDPTLRSMVQSYGLQLDADGAARLQVSGTVSRPILR